MKAIELFNQGWRLEGWGSALTDSFNEIRLSKDGSLEGLWADGANRDTDDAFDIIGLENSDESDDVLFQLCDLTETD